MLVVTFGHNIDATDLNQLHVFSVTRHAPLTSSGGRREEGEGRRDGQMGTEAWMESSVTKHETVLVQCMI